MAASATILPFMAYWGGNWTGSWVKFSMVLVSVVTLLYLPRVAVPAWLARLVLRSRVLRLATRKRLGAGGAIIALVGGDGAGKSTAVGAAHAWLAKYFETRTIHLGKPPQSWATRSIRAASLASRWLGARLGRNWSMSAGLMACGAGYADEKAVSLGPNTSQPPCAGSTLPAPRQGENVEALRPAWAI